MTTQSSLGQVKIGTRVYNNFSTNKRDLLTCLE